MKLAKLNVKAHKFKYLNILYNMFIFSSQSVLYDMLFFFKIFTALI